MGASQSSESDTTKHVFTSSQPINFSPELIDSLSSSSETNSTRAKTLDLHIQQRVSEELAKLLNQEDNRLADARKRIEQQSSSSSSSDSSSSSSDDSSSPSLRDLVSASTTSSNSDQKQQTSQKVQDEIDKLKQQLSQRKVLKVLPKEVSQARDGVISCLRLNDRRPLDCWKEVEIFKREVRKMEDEFVRKVL